MARHDPRRLDASAYPWSVDLETRFGDMDVNFHLNNVAIAGLYEEARVRFNWHIRDNYPVGHPRFVVARLEIDYLDEGKYRVPTSMGLFQPDGCIGLSDTVMVHRGDDGPAPIPDSLRAALGDFALRP